MTDAIPFDAIASTGGWVIIIIIAVWALGFILSIFGGYGDLEGPCLSILFSRTVAGGCGCALFVVLGIILAAVLIFRSAIGA